jgi:hypothetical protein
MKNSENAGIPTSDIILLWGRPGRLSGIGADTSCNPRGNWSTSLILEVHHTAL